MARSKFIDTNPRFLPVDPAAQLLPGTFAHAAHHLLAHAVDRSRCDARFRNDDTGAPAYPPRMLLTVVLCAYAHGGVSSRGIERLCREHVTCIALCGDTAPHFTTLARFVSMLGADIAHVFAAVLAVCDRQGLIGREMFALDGVKLPSHAVKQRSGTRADVERQAAKLEAAAAVMVARHRPEDAQPVEPDLRAKETQHIARLERDATELRDWLAANTEDRKGPTGGVRQSNRTDPERAKMATSKGVIQGYTGVAAVDSAHQIIVAAQAHGTGAEQEVLLPVVEALAPVRTSTTLVTADAGYHSEANLGALDAQAIPALIADAALRQRDPRFATQERHHAKPDPLHDKTPASAEPRVFGPQDFTYDVEARTCVCPAGKALYRRGKDQVTRGYVADHFRGAKRECGPCALRAQCLRTPERTPTCRRALARSPSSGARRRARRSATRTARAGALRATLRPGGAGIRQPAREHATRPLHAAWADAGGRAVEAVLPGAQHREARPPRLRGIAAPRTRPLAYAARPLRTRTARQPNAASRSGDPEARHQPRDSA